jgi:metal-responsive CopG/Arc/MetJ family transcriptional regulator
MARLTISVDDKLLESARSIARSRNSTIQQLVRDYLQQLPEIEARRQEAKQRLLTTRFDYDPTPLDRDSIYER